MITSFHTNYAHQPPTSFYMVTELEGLDDKPRKLFPEHIEFKPGLNIIVGGNGSGKTTLLKALWTESLYSSIPDKDEYGGGGLAARRELAKVFEFGPAYGKFLKGADVSKIKGKEFFDIRMDFNEPVYLMKEISSFSSDKAMANFNNFGNFFQNMHSSKGEKLLGSIRNFAQQINDTHEERNRYSIEALIEKLYLPSPSMKSVIRNYINEHQENVAHTQPTILIDEIDAGLDVFGLYAVRKWLLNAASNFQMIVVLHNATLIQSFIGSAHFIELTDDYLNYLQMFNEGKELPYTKPENKRDTIKIDNEKSSN